MTDWKAIEALIESRLSEDEKRQVRETVARTAERAALNNQFSLLVAKYREANPASVSPRMGFA